MIFFPLLGSDFGIIEMMNLQPRQPMKNSMDQFVLVERFWGLGRANEIALPNYMKLDMFLNLSGLQIRQL